MPLKTTVPIDIRPPFEKGLGRESEAWSMSSSHNRSGDPGETWIVATKTRLLIGDRGFGGPIALREIELKDVQGCELEGGSFGAGRVVIVGKSGALDHVCFSSLERDDFARLGERIRAGSGEVAGTAPVVLASPPVEAATRAKRKPKDEVPMALAAPEKKTSRKLLPAYRGRVPGRGLFELFLDQPYAFPGSSITGVLRLHWPKDRAVRGVRLSWAGTEKTRVTVGSGKQSRTYAENHAWASDCLGCFGAAEPLGFFGSMGDAMTSKDRLVLRAGSWEYPFEFAVPRHAPAAYNGSHVQVTWALNAIVDVPRAFDLVSTFPIRVIPALPAEVGERQVRQVGSVVVRARLEPGPIGPGMPVKGEFNVSNPSGKTIRWVNVRIVRLETATASGHTKTTEVVESAVRFPGKRIGGIDVPFEVSLPESFCPWTGRFSSLRYEVVIDLDVAWAFDVQVRLAVP